MSVSLAIAKFRLGQIVTTPNALSKLSEADMLGAITRHQAGDWGSLDKHDWDENERALQHGGRLFSRYETEAGVKFWIITEPGREHSTILMPEDY
jgi:hypothetical protein